MGGCRWYLFAEQTDAFDAARDGPVLDRVLARLAAAPHIARVIWPTDMAALGYPDYDDSPYTRGHHIVAADIDTHLVLDAADPSRSRRLKAKPYHGHGYLPSHPAMYPALVLSGAGIAPGRRLGHVRNIDVAPTIAAILKVSMPGAEEARAAGGAAVSPAVDHRASTRRGMSLPIHDGAAYRSATHSGSVRRLVRDGVDTSLVRCFVRVAARVLRVVRG